MKIVYYMNTMSNCVIVDIFYDLEEIVFFGYCNEEFARKSVSIFSIGMWKIKKLK